MFVSSWKTHFSGEKKDNLKINRILGSNVCHIEKYKYKKIDEVAIL